MKYLCENCGKCCIETEMILSQQDIDVIVKNYPSKIRKQDFTFRNEEGNYQIKNFEKHCVFLEFSTKTCKIYEYRPQGCRFYPLIYDFQKQNCTFDKDCPRIYLFYQDQGILKETCDNLKIFIKNQLNINLD
jgi:Fe-S-cluster containining protein